MKQNDTMRFSRHFLIPGWGLEEQDRMLRAKVCVPTSMPLSATYLVAAGVRNLSISRSLASDNLPHDAVFCEHLLNFEPDLNLTLIEREDIDSEYFDLVIVDTQQAKHEFSERGANSGDRIQIQEQSFEARCNWKAGDEPSVTAPSRLLLESSVAMIAISRLLMNSGAN